jgi:uroporphyrinogen-III synthase
LHSNYASKGLIERDLAMSLIVTRPQPQADAWVSALEQSGCSAQALPLMDIAAIEDTRGIEMAVRRWREWQAVMFVSASAVKHFFAKAAVPLDHAVVCWATGPGTRQALIDAGIAEAHIVSPDALATQFDSEALWAIVRHKVHTHAPVLIVRGQDGPDISVAGPHNTEMAKPQGVGRDWLAQQLHSCGVSVELIAAYERRLPVWHDEQRVLVQQAVNDGAIWHFSSSQALAHLCQLMPALDVSQLACWVTHPRIADKARALGYEQVSVCPPTLAGLIAHCREIGKV